MNPVEADTARVDAMSGGILRNWMGRIARNLIASQVTLGRAFDRLLPRSFRIDGSKDFKLRIVPSCVSSYFTSAVRTATRRVKSAQLWFDAGSRAKSEIAAIQVLRAIAALSVVIGHTQRNAILIAAANHREFHPILLDLTEAGVDLFFVISGFVMVYASRDLFAAPGGGLVFLSRRIIRIVPLYWSMTTIFLAVMLASLKLIPVARPELTEILASYFFIPYYPPDAHWMHPIYSVGWTLNYEMFFYAVFGCVIALPVNRALTALTILFCALTIAHLILRPAPGVFFFWSRPVILEFVMGAWIGYARLMEFRTTNRAASILALAGIAGFALQVMSGVYAHDYWRPLVWGLPAAAIVVAATLSNWNITSRGLWKPIILLGGASYSLYLLHPMAVHAMHLLWDKLGLSAHASDTVFFFVTLAPMPLLAIAIYLCFEKPVTKALQVLLRNRFVPLRPFSRGPTGPEGASKHGHSTGMHVAREQAAKTFP